MEVNQEKLDRQLIGIEKWVHSTSYGAHRNGCGTLHWFTGVGKTYAAMIVINRLLDRSPNSRIIVETPSEAVQKQWLAEVKLHLTPDRWNHVEIYSINYLVENKASLDCDLLITDEIHEFLTDVRLPYINGTRVRYKFNLGLTATPHDKNRYKSLHTICPIIDEISEREALERGFVSRYIEYNLAAYMTKEEELIYNEYTRVVSNLLPRFAKSLDFVTKCLNGGIHDVSGSATYGQKFSGFAYCYGWARKHGWYPDGNIDDEEYSKINQLWNPNIIMANARNLMDAIRHRKDILYNAINKAFAAIEVVRKFPMLKTICFSQSTAFADKLNLLINREFPDSCMTYHSKIETVERYNSKTNKNQKFGKVRLKREAIDNIKSGKIMRISTASALDKGFNVEDIRMAITTSATSNPTQHKQRKGRAIRLEIYAPDTTVLIINIYIPNTVDEKWLRNRQKKSSNIIYWVESVDEINYSPKDKEVFSLDF